jgi:hypothetical protein
VQLDRTRIVVRQRGVLDTLDLALHVLRVYLAPLMIAMALGALPLMLINHLLIAWMLPDADNLLDIPARYLWHMTILIFLQAPLASVFATTYLGQAVFQDRPRLTEVVREVMKLAPRILWSLVLIRGVGAAWLLLLAVDRYGEFDSFVDMFLPLVLVTWAIGLRAFRPFIGEIILLEQNPLVGRDAETITVGRRSRMLHGPASGDLFLRWWTSAGIAVLLTGTVYGTMLFLVGVLTNDWRQGPGMLLVAYPAAIWTVAAYLTVFRFLTYLDARIRQEGWEVELRVRAEASRLVVRMLVAAAVMCWTTNAIAQETTEAIEAGRRALSAGPSFPWYDKQQDDLRPVHVQPPRESALNRGSRWQAAPEDPQRDSSWLTSIVNALAQGLRWLGLIGLIALLVALAVLLARAFLMREEKGSDDQQAARGLSPLEADRIDNLPFSIAHPPTDLLAEAQRCYQQGDLNQAMIYLFSYQLLALDRHDLIRLTRGKTNRQYLAELAAQPGLQQLLRPSMVAFEEVFFGKHRLTRDRFERCWQNLDTFHKDLQRLVTP